MLGVAPFNTLLVEDEDAHAELISRAFQGHDGFVLARAGSFGEAARMLENAGDCLVLLDMRLPDGDGIEFLESRDFAGTHPVIVMTSFGDEQRAVQAMRAGALDYIVKSESVFREMPRIAERALRGWTHIVERRRVEGLLRESLAEKDALLKEIHHRVKNNMQVISSLLSLQAGLLDDPRAILCFEESRQRINSMALIHERLYKSGSFVHIGFDEYLNDLAAQLQSAACRDHPALRVQVDAAAATLDIDRAIPAALLANELAANAIRHAFPSGEGGEVRIVFCKQDGVYRLEVCDNGCGLPEGIVIGEPLTLGLQLVKILIGQVNGRLEVHSEPGQGSRFSIIFGT